MRTVAGAVHRDSGLLDGQELEIHAVGFVDPRGNLGSLFVARAVLPLDPGQAGLTGQLPRKQQGHHAILLASTHRCKTTTQR